MNDIAKLVALHTLLEAQRALLPEAARASTIPAPFALPRALQRRILSASIPVSRRPTHPRFQIPRRRSMRT
jgi:hypothetical protein